MEIHLRIPAERWCITKKEFFDFVEDVRRLWKRGAIPTLTDWPNLKHDCHMHGPNLYEVNVHHVKPLTLAAGGMSYALMKHPEGLPCEVFVSHAWAEGVFELCGHVRRAWPQGLKKQNLYCCLLANPQNLDIEALLNRPPIESPFALAMQRASHVLVIPNDTVSIYTRLWCVYEIFLASEWKKTCVIPAQPPWSALRHMVTWTLLPSVIGLALGCLWLIAVHFSPESMELHTRVLDNGLLLSLELALVTAIIDLTVRLCAVYNCRWHLHFPRWSLLGHLGFCLLQMLMQVSSSACIVPWGVFPSGFSTVYDHILHYGIAFCVWSGGTVFCLARAHTELERKEMHRQASCLSFDSLDQAVCSNALDEERIRCAISGSEDNVLLAVNVLKSAGACNPLLQRAYTIGLDVRGSGIGHVFMRALAAAGIWVVSIMEELASSSIWEDCPNGQIWSIALAGGIPVCMLGTLLAARYWRPYGPEKVTFVMNSCMFTGLSAILLPFLIAAAQGLREFKRLPVVVRLAHSPQITECPSYATWFGAVMLRPLLAFATLLLAWFGPLLMHLIYGRDEPEDLSCPHAKERDFSGVQPDLELDVDIVDIDRCDSGKTS